MKGTKFCVWIVLFFVSVSLLGAQGTTRDTGAIRGVVADDQGSPLPGVNVTVTSPSLMGSTSATTNADGIYRITLLPVGTYTLVTELQGFQPVKREGLIVSLGMTLAVNITMTAATLQEAVTVVGESPVVDVKASTGTQILKSDVLQSLPMRRNLFSAIALIPGVVGGDNDAAIKGGTAANTILSVDGLYANDPDNSLPVGAKLDYNVLEEVSVITAGMSADIGTASGGFVNVVTKGGSNKFTGLVQAYYDNETFSTVVLPEEQIRALGLGKPAVPLYTYDLALGAGGPILKDKLWFYVNVRGTDSKRGSGFNPWTAPTGASYGDYDIKDSTYEGFLKLSFQPLKALRFSFSGNYRAEYQNTAASGLYNPFDTSYKYYPRAWVQGTGVMTWVMNPNTIMEIRGGYLARVADYPQVNPENTDVPYMTDAYTSYNFGSGSRPHEWLIRPSTQLSAQWTRFQDNFLGGNHEFKSGVELYTGAARWASWKNEPMYWRWYNGNPYYYRGLYGLSGPHPLYGDGYVGWRNYGPTKDGAFAEASELRIGAFLQDSMTIKNRLTINFGVRFDHTTGRIPDIYHKAAGGAAVAVGQAVFVPKYGVNPYAEFRQEGASDLIEWNVLNPRLGVTYDLFGDGKTAVKFNVGRYSDWLHASLLYSIHPNMPGTYYFRWWDKNNNRYPDAPPIDYYEDSGLSDPSTILREKWIKLVRPGIKSPYDDQIYLGVDRELFTNFKIGVSYQYKKKSNIVDQVLTDGNTGKSWYQPDSGYWVPFTTTVPARDQFPAQQITMYFKTNNAPSRILSLANVPEAYRKYSCLEISFDKRMSHGWQLGGSINWSKTWGNHPGTYGDIVNAGARTANDANWFVNEEGRLSDDRPLVIKLFGTFRLPFRIITSFFYNFYNGTPWQRSVSVTPPAAWAKANNVDPYTPYTVNLETLGSRRNYTFQNCDFRLEKTFGFGRLGQLGVYVDIFNLLAQSYVNITQNPGGTWLPTDNNSTTGKYTASGSYKRITSISNLSRVLRLSVRYSF